MRHKTQLKLPWFKEKARLRAAVSFSLGTDVISRQQSNIGDFFDDALTAG